MKELDAVAARGCCKGRPRQLEHAAPAHMLPRLCVMFAASVSQHSPCHGAAMSPAGKLQPGQQASQRSVFQQPACISYRVRQHSKRGVSAKRNVNV
jgi:hypothetical protein